MQYDPIKRSLGTVFNKSPFLRKSFYNMLDVLLLRSWYVKRDLRQWAKKEAPLQVAALDAGAGFGQYSYFMSKLGSHWTVKAVDVKEEQIDDCNRFFLQVNKSDRVRFEVGDLTKFTDTDAFNLIVCVDVMEHIESDDQVFANFYRALKNDGMLLVSTPSDLGGSDAHDHEEEGFVDEHVRDGYNFEAIQQQLSKAGFTRTEAHYTYGTWGSLAWRLLMKYPILLLNISKVFFILLPFYYLITMPFALLFNCLDMSGTNKKGSGLVVKAWK